LSSFSLGPKTSGVRSWSLPTNHRLFSTPPHPPKTTRTDTPRRSGSLFSFSLGHSPPSSSVRGFAVLFFSQLPLLVFTHSPFPLPRHNCREASPLPLPLFSTSRCETSSIAFMIHPCFSLFAPPLCSPSAGFPRFSDGPLPFCVLP